MAYGDSELRCTVCIIFLLDSAALTIQPLLVPSSLRPAHGPTGVLLAGAAPASPEPLGQGHSPLQASEALVKVPPPPHLDHWSSIYLSFFPSPLDHVSSHTLPCGLPQYLSDAIVGCISLGVLSGSTSISPASVGAREGGPVRLISEPAASLAQHDRLAGGADQKMVCELQSVPGFSLQNFCLSYKTVSQNQDTPIQQ